MTRRPLVLAAVLIVAVLPGAGLDHLTPPVPVESTHACSVDLSPYLTVPHGVEGQ